VITQCQLQINMEVMLTEESQCYLVHHKNNMDLNGTDCWPPWLQTGEKFPYASYGTILSMVE
jgi:hypothetical protein